MKNLIVSIFLLLLFCVAVFAQSEIKGRVIEVIDGKTVVIEVGPSNKITAQLQFIEVPEPEQPLYQTVKDHLGQLLLGQRIFFKPYRLVGTKTVGRIFAGQTDVSQQMIRDGAAWYAVEQKSGQESSEREIYQQTEAQAKVEKLGVWSIADLKPAWQIRAERAEYEKQQATLAQAKADQDAAQADAAALAAKAKKAAMRPKMDSESNLWLANDEPRMPANFSNVGSLLVGYNPQFKFGVVGTPLSKFEVSDSQNRINIGVGIVYFYADGDTKGRESFYGISIESKSDDWQFLKENEMIVTADKQKIIIGKAKRGAHQNALSVTENLNYYVQRSVLTKISKAKNVEVKVGKYSGKMTDEMQLMLHNLLRASE